MAKISTISCITQVTFLYTFHWVIYGRKLTFILLELDVLLQKEFSSIVFIICLFKDICNVSFQRQNSIKSFLNSEKSVHDGDSPLSKLPSKKRYE